MKKLAFLLPAMRMGGAEKIALNFLKQLMPYYEVTIVLNRAEGELLEALPSDCVLKEDRLLSYSEIVKKDLAHFSVRFLWEDLLYYSKVKFGKDSEKNYRYLVSRSPWELGQFDIAIGYVANVSTQIFSLADRVKANCKIAWVHGETNELRDTALFERIYHDFDRVFCVSEISRRHFIERFPSCKIHTDVYYNPIDRDSILRGAEMPMEYSFSKESFNIVSVGRLTHEKGFSMVPEILRILLNHGKNQVHWYLIGDGSEREYIRQKAQKNGVSEMLTMLGTLKNPYPYIKACDLYVQPSFEEGYSTTICEAGILGKPIIGTTTSGGIYEQVEDGISALLAEPTPCSIADKIIYLEEKVLFRKSLSEKVLEIDFNHISQLGKFMNIGVADEND